MGALHPPLWQDGLSGRIGWTDDLKALWRWTVTPLRLILARYDLHPGLTQPPVFVVRKDGDSFETNRLTSDDRAGVCHVWLIADPPPRSMR